MPIAKQIHALVHPTYIGIDTPDALLHPQHAGLVEQWRQIIQSCIGNPESIFILFGGMTNTDVHTRRTRREATDGEPAFTAEFTLYQEAQQMLGDRFIFVAYDTDFFHKDAGILHHELSRRGMTYDRNTSVTIFGQLFEQCVSNHARIIQRELGIIPTSLREQSLTGEQASVIYSETRETMCAKPRFRG